MLSKTDIKIIKNLLKNFATKDDLKNFTTKDDLKDLAKQKDLLEVKEKLDNLYQFSEEAFGNLLEWTDDIHKSLVKEKLPERVRKLEHILKSS